MIRSLTITAALGLIITTSLGAADDDAGRVINLGKMGKGLTITLGPEAPDGTVPLLVSGEISEFPWRGGPIVPAACAAQRDIDDNLCFEIYLELQEESGGCELLPPGKDRRFLLKGCLITTSGLDGDTEDDDMGSLEGYTGSVGYAKGPVSS